MRTFALRLVLLTNKIVLLLVENDSIPLVIDGPGLDVPTSLLSLPALEAIHSPEALLRGLGPPPGLLLVRRAAGGVDPSPARLVHRRLLLRLPQALAVLPLRPAVVHSLAPEVLAEVE